MPRFSLSICSQRASRNYKDVGYLLLQSEDVEVAAIDAQLQSQRYVRQLPPFPPDLVKRIIEGAKVAEDLTLKLLKFLD